MLRITSGTLRNKRIHTLPNKTTRPSTEKVRQIIFNCLYHHIDLKDFITYDLFAGTGALGMEAISWGSAKSIFIEKNKPAFYNLKKNIINLAIEEQSELYLTNAVSWLETYRFTKQPSLFLLDPPYENQITETVLEKISNLNLRDNHVIVVLERNNNNPILFSDQFKLFQHKKTGITCIDFLQLV